MDKKIYILQLTDSAGRLKSCTRPCLPLNFESKPGEHLPLFFFQKKILTINLLDIISLEQPFAQVEQFLLKAFTVFQVDCLTGILYCWSY